MILRGEDEIRFVLRQQMQQLQVSSREFTGAGFFSNFVVDPAARRITGRPTLTLGNVEGTATNVSHGLGFVLFVKDGALSMLEGYTYDEPWPDELPGLKLSYSTQQEPPPDLEKRI